MDLNILFSVCCLCKERTEHHRNASKNHNEISQLLEWMFSDKKQLLVRMWKKGNPLALLVGLCSHYGKQQALPRWLRAEESANAAGTGDMSLIPGLKDSWTEKWQTVPVFLPGKFHGQRSLCYLVHGVAKSLTQLSN